MRTVLPASPLQRLRRELFSSPLDGLISIGLIGFLLAVVIALVKWALFQAQWAVLQANSTLFAVGRYPLEQQWRLWLLTTLLVGATGLSWGLLRGLPRLDRVDQLQIGNAAADGGDIDGQAHGQV